MKPITPQNKLNTNSGVTLDINRTRKQIVKLCEEYGENTKINKCFPIALAAVIEYIYAELFTLTSTKSNNITLISIKNVIKCDEELRRYIFCDFFSHTQNRIYQDGNIMKVCMIVKENAKLNKKSLLFMHYLSNYMCYGLVVACIKLLSYSGKNTLTPKELKYAISITIPGELKKHAISEMTKAVTKYKCVNFK